MRAWRVFLRRVRVDVSELRRLIRAVIASRSKLLVGYAKVHPVYTDSFEHHPPTGYHFYRRTTRPWLSRIDRWIWRRIVLMHRDAAHDRDETASVAEVVECEAVPSTALIEDSRVAHIFVESEHAGRYHLQRTSKVSLLRPAVAPRRAQRRAAAPPPYRILAVGHGGMLKGFDVVHQVFESVRAEFDVRLMIIGTFGHNWHFYPEISRAAFDGRGFPEIHARLRNDQHVTLGVARRDRLLTRIYPSAHVYLHLARMETFGFSILEAMTYGLPVIATDINAIPEMVDHGVTGLLVSPGDADINSPEWAEIMTSEATAALRRILADDDLRLAMGEAGRTRARDSFSPQWKADELARVYQQVLAPPSGVPDVDGKVGEAGSQPPTGVALPSDFDRRHPNLTATKDARTNDPAKRPDDLQ